MYEVFDHTADIGLRVRANSLEGLFAEAGRGFLSLVVTNLEAIEPREKIQIELSGREQETEYLLFDWLNELLFLFETKHLLLAKFDVQLSAIGLKATAWGEPVDTGRHRLEHEVKAITYHGLKVTREADEWLAEVIVDI
ncbi:MAG TPA: archease [Pirellulales bacterium]|jgi:SHS2 domain-containing protein